MHVAITSIRKYHEARGVLLSSLPPEWNYIIIYQNEPENFIKVGEDGNIEVAITQNLYEYGTFIGLNMVLEMGLVPKDSWFLCLHDTCKAGPRFKSSIEDIIRHEKDSDIVWLCCTGQCNLCLLRNVVPHGFNVYNGMEMSKQHAIDIEYRGKDSIKTFPCKQFFLKYQVLFDGPREVYNDPLYGKRVIVKFENIDLEKYYFYRP
jgi:hypothetical protein